MVTAHIPDRVLIGLEPEFLDPSTEPYYDEKRRCWHVFSHEDVARVATDAGSFSQAFGDLTPGDLNGRVMWNADGPRHSDLRHLVREPFSRRRLRDLQPFIRETTGRLLDRVDKHGDPFEVVTALAAPLPGVVICQIMGLALTADEQFDRWLAEFTAASALHQTPEQLDKTRFFTELLAERKRHPGEGLADELIGAQQDGYQVEGKLLDDLDIAGYLWGLVAAGKQTTCAGIADMLLLLAERGAWDELRSEPGLRDTAIAECLRLCPPSPTIAARVRAETGDAVTFGGHQIPPGEVVTGWLSAASRDPVLFPDPDAFRLDRHPNPHLAFGWGPHRCLGEPLAQLEMRAVLDDVVERGWSPRWERTLPYGRVPGFVNSVSEAWMSRG